jgi:UDP-glucose 4-epimerase
VAAWVMNRFALITGANGFIGRALSQTLASSGFGVIGVGHGPADESELRLFGMKKWLRGDITSVNLDSACDVLPPLSAVFHLAGGSSVGAASMSPHADFQRTVVSTANLLEWLRQHSPDTPVVAVSSAAVYGANHAEPILESDSLSPISPYGSHKLMMEQLCRSYAASYGIRVVMPRLFSVYGPGLRKQLLWDLCERISAGHGLELGGTGEERRDWVHVADVARCLVAVAAHADGTSPAVNVGTGIARSVRDISTGVVRAWGQNASGGVVTFSGRSRPGNPTSLVANVERMQSWGLMARTAVTQGIEEYVHWYRSAKGPRG